MGEGYVMKCGKCGKRHMINLGIGMMFPTVFDEVQHDARQGYYGKDLQAFLQDHPEAVCNAENELYLCPECGQWEVSPALSVYEPKEGVTVRPYAMAEDLRADYRCIKQYRHRCGRCGTVMRKWNGRPEIRELHLKCPDCGEELTCEGDIFWD